MKKTPIQSYSKIDIKIGLVERGVMGLTNSLIKVTIPRIFFLGSKKISDFDVDFFKATRHQCLPSHKISSKSNQ